MHNEFGQNPSGNDHSGPGYSDYGDSGDAASAFRFRGSWKEFAGIAIPNVLLTIVTLGIYRFWATTRERQYLWSKSDFINAPLEWTGRGIELFIGFVMAVLLFFLPFFALQFVVQALVLQGYGGWAALLSLASFLPIFYLAGVARFRALRYRLSRTYWHGIRGGSNDPGFGYGWSSLWKTFCGYLALGLLVPWSMMELWNERWSKMSFGPHRFDAVASHSDVFARYLLFYLTPILLVVASFAMVGIAGAVQSVGGMVAATMGFVFIFYGLLGIIALAFYAKFFRVAVSGLSLHKLDFSFTARTKDWFILFLGDLGIWLLAAIPIALIGSALGLFASFGQLNPEIDPGGFQRMIFVSAIILAVIPFALVGPFIRYRHWKFFITYMAAYGEVSLEELTQSETVLTSHGEGLLDALDVGAI